MTRPPAIGQCSCEPTSASTIPAATRTLTRQRGSGQATDMSLGAQAWNTAAAHSDSDTEGCCGWAASACIGDLSQSHRGCDVSASKSSGGQCHPGDDSVSAHRCGDPLMRSPLDAPTLALLPERSAAYERRSVADAYGRDRRFRRWRSLNFRLYRCVRPGSAALGSGRVQAADVAAERLTGLSQWKHARVVRDRVRLLCTAMARKSD